MPGDTMSVHANFKKAVANGAELLLHDNIYKVANVDWQGGDLVMIKTMYAMQRQVLMQHI